MGDVTCQLNGLQYSQIRTDLKDFNREKSFSPQIPTFPDCHQSWKKPWMRWPKPPLRGPTIGSPQSTRYLDRKPTCSDLLGSGTPHSCQPQDLPPDAKKINSVQVRVARQVAVTSDFVVFTIESGDTGTSPLLCYTANQSVPIHRPTLRPIESFLLEFFRFSFISPCAALVSLFFSSLVPFLYSNPLHSFPSFPSIPRARCVVTIFPYIDSPPFSPIHLHFLYQHHIDWDWRKPSVIL